MIAIQSFLIRRPGMTILLDSCSGNHKERNRPFFHRRKWAWLETLHAAGVAPEHVDLVLCSHLHVDHVGWNTRLENGQWVPDLSQCPVLGVTSRVGVLAIQRRHRQFAAHWRFH